jgi:hypothetical protein
MALGYDRDHHQERADEHQRGAEQDQAEFDPKIHAGIL